jgi:hypothetical protein
MPVKAGGMVPSGLSHRGSGYRCAVAPAHGPTWQFPSPAAMILPRLAEESRCTQISRAKQATRIDRKRHSRKGLTRLVLPAPASMSANSTLRDRSLWWRCRDVSSASLAIIRRIRPFRPSSAIIPVICTLSMAKRMALSPTLTRATGFRFPRSGDLRVSAWPTLPFRTSHGNG